MKRRCNDGRKREMVIARPVASSWTVIIGPGDLGERTHRLRDDGLAVAAAIAGVGYFLVGRHVRARLSLLDYLYPVYRAGVLVLMTVMRVSGLPRLPQDSNPWLWLMPLDLGPQIVGHSWLNLVLGYLPAINVTLSTAWEPIGSTRLAWGLLGEQHTRWAVVAGLLILLSGIVVASPAGQRAQEG